jgi:hypothetical protein
MEFAKSIIMELLSSAELPRIFPVFAAHPTQISNDSLMEICLVPDEEA